VSYLRSKTTISPVLHFREASAVQSTRNRSAFSGENIAPNTAVWPHILHFSSESPARYCILKRYGGGRSLGQTRLWLHFPANREIYRVFGDFWALLPSRLSRLTGDF
jgi:hypothetical protein